MKRNIYLSVASTLALAFSAELSLGASFTATPVADAFVTTGPSGNLSNNNYGGGGALAVAAGALPNGQFETVMRFDLSGVRASLDSTFGAGQWDIQSVSLQLSSSAHGNAIYNAPAPGMFGVSLMVNNSWVEGTGNASNPASIGITYNTLLSVLLPPADQPLGTFSFPGGTSGINIYSLALAPQLTSDIAAGANLSLRLFAADNSVSYLFSSREATPVSEEPQLIVTAIPEPRFLALFGIGAGLLLASQSRQRRNAETWKCFPTGHPSIK
jgi:hypothetical protein